MLGVTQKAENPRRISPIRTMLSAQFGNTAAHDSVLEYLPSSAFVDHGPNSLGRR